MFNFDVQESSKPIPLVPRCGSCGLHKTCTSPKMASITPKRAKVLILGEAPGSHEDQHGEPFVGVSGQYLRSVVRKCGVEWEDVAVTNALICRPPGNATPTEKQILWCRPNLDETIRKVNPEVIITVGKAALNSLLLDRWSSPGDFDRWTGWQIPDQTGNFWICPTWHPARVLREKDTIPTYEIYFENHLRRAFGLQGRPWDEVPDYKAACTVSYDEDEVEQRLAQYVRSGKLIAFDYETNMLKPDSVRSRIVSCSFSDGETAIAYPWTKRTAKLTKTALLSSNPKCGSNVKFEERWTKQVLGISVRNWKWDTMLASHCIDNRERINSVKFQSFVRLGFPDYDKEVSPYLKSSLDPEAVKSGYSENRIKEADLNKLLLYNAIDSLVEVLVAEDQMEEYGYETNLS